MRGESGEQQYRINRISHSGQRAHRRTDETEGMGRKRKTETAGGEMGGRKHSVRQGRERARGRLGTGAEEREAPPPSCTSTQVTQMPCRGREIRLTTCQAHGPKLRRPSLWSCDDLDVVLLGSCL